MGSVAGFSGVSDCDGPIDLVRSRPLRTSFASFRSESMDKLLRALSLAIASASALAVAACGGSGGSSGGAEVNPGSGSISITSFFPNPILGCAPTPFTITGTNFEDVTGTTAIVKFTALTGAPFGGGAIATVIGSVQNATTITGISPTVTICGVASISVQIDVTLESGV